MRKTCLLIGLMLSTLAAHAAPVDVRDDAGQLIKLATPAQRIVSLAPHVTENLFAAGAGSKLVGVVEHSDFPPAAKQIQSVGGYTRLDLEKVVALRPDLVIAWDSGNAKGQIEKLRALGLTVFVSQPNDLDDIAVQLEKFGQLAGTDATARKAAQDYRQRLAQLKKRYSGQAPVKVFYQVWKQPLVTIGGQQIISKAILLCSGENVFGQLGNLAPTVSVEAVIAAKPELIVASGMGESRPEWLDDWLAWKSIPAVANGQLGFIPPPLIQRHTPRLLDGTERLCQLIDQARKLR